MPTLPGVLAAAALAAAVGAAAAQLPNDGSPWLLLPWLPHPLLLLLLLVAAGRKLEAAAAAAADVYPANADIAEAGIGCLGAEAACSVVLRGVTAEAVAGPADTLSG